jgi:hypothetical protein
MRIFGFEIPIPGTLLMSLKKPNPLFSAFTREKEEEP